MQDAHIVLTAIVIAALAWGVYRVLFSGERVGKVSFPLLGDSGRMSITVARVSPGADGEHAVRLRFGVPMGSKSQTWSPRQAIALAEALERGAALVDRRVAP